MDRLIYDRTDADVTYAIENQSSPQHLKGAYNYSDLNRIEEWCEYLATELTNVGYVISITTKTDWTEDDFPTQAQLERIRNNVNTIKTAYYSSTNVPSNMNKMTFKKANDIEKVLDEIYHLMWGMENWYVYCGVSNCGQNRVWQHRFRQFFNPPRQESFSTWFDLLDVTWADLGDMMWTDFV